MPETPPVSNSYGIVVQTQISPLPIISRRVGGDLTILCVGETTVAREAEKQKKN